MSFYSVACQFIDDPSGVDDELVLQLKHYIIQGHRFFFDKTVGDISLVCREALFTEELVAGAHENASHLIIHLPQDEGVGIAIEPDGNVVLGNIFNPSFLHLQEPSGWDWYASTDWRNLIQYLKCDGCGNGFDENDRLFTDGKGYDLCMSCESLKGDDCSLVSVRDRVASENLKRQKDIAFALGFEFDGNEDEHAVGS